MIITQHNDNRRKGSPMIGRIIPAAVVALTVALVMAIPIITALILFALVTPGAHASERYPQGRQEHYERPHYTPSWERTQRRYLPSYQYELERRRYCGNMCDDVRERRDPFER